MEKSLRILATPGRGFSKLQATDYWSVSEYFFKVPDAFKNNLSNAEYSAFITRIKHHTPQVSRFKKRNFAILLFILLIGSLFGLVIPCVGTAVSDKNNFLSDDYVYTECDSIETCRFDQFCDHFGNCVSCNYYKSEKRCEEKYLKRETPQMDVYMACVRTCLVQGGHTLSTYRCSHWMGQEGLSFQRLYAWAGGVLVIICTVALCLMQSGVLFTPVPVLNEELENQMQLFVDSEAKGMEDKGVKLTKVVVESEVGPNIGQEPRSDNAVGFFIMELVCEGGVGGEEKAML